MTDWLFAPPATPTIAIDGVDEAYPVRRIFCVGRNYVAHAIEMGVAVDREAPFYFTKSAHAICPSGTTVAYPPGTENYHYEMELVVAVGAEVYQISPEQAPAAVYAYGCGLDMTRRDLQLAAREKQRPWDLGKDFEDSAVMAPFALAAQFGEPGPQRIQLKVNGEVRQDAHIADLIWSVPELVSHLSGYYHLGPGDLIMTGTPAGVGPLVPGDKVEGSIDRLAPVALTIGAAQ